MDIGVQVLTLIGAMVSAQWAFARLTLRALERIIQAQEQTLREHLVRLEQAVRGNTEALQALKEALAGVRLNGSRRVTNRKE
ncbi:MAG: hypothetical protein KatS3mg022_2650 [Armatimonadota bacterium]|nr:MAG: hypothetical protein KatS3mg022_2650 [Armatimonadota bacterium]